MRERNVQQPALEENTTSHDPLRATVESVLHQLEHGEASDGDLRDIAWCARTLRDALQENPKTHPRQVLRYVYGTDEQDRQEVERLDQIEAGREITQ